MERALKVLKRQLIKDGLLKELKRRRFYEKPSIKKKLKQKEARKKRKAAMKQSYLSLHGFFFTGPWAFLIFRLDKLK